jgi:hypothetical protein
VCVHCYIVAHLSAHCCHVTATVRSLLILVGEDVAVDYINVFSVAADMKKCFPFSLLASYKIFRTAVNNNVMSGCLYSCFSYAAWKSHLFCAILYCHLRPACLYHIYSPPPSPTFHERHDSRKKTVLNVKCLFWFSPQLLSETFPILRRIRRGIITHIHRSSCEAPAILVRHNETWAFSTDFRKVLKYQISWKSV